LATSQQRAWRAACPNCGAPVEFASAASASAVCGFCKSTLLRDGEALERIGVSAELFDDHSPLRLGASGTLQGRSFTLVGRLQFGYRTGPQASASPSPPPEGADSPTGKAGSGLDGTWNEWHALFDNGRSAWLSEDNGAYVLAVDSALPADAPQLEELRAGQRTLADQRVWDVASVVRARLIAAEGELPSPPRLQGDFLVADLRSSQGEVATLDGSGLDRPNGAVHWSVGRSVLLADLRMQGLAEASEKTLQGRALECPSCGAALEPRLGTTRSLACGQCKAVVDISAGAGAELAFFAQNNSGAGGLEPQIPLGKTGRLALGSGEAAPWQVVGYLERCDIPDDGDEDQTFWREYLLWNSTLGFAFLVDAEDGWSWVRPITGAPQVLGEGARYEGVSYRKKYTYTAKVTWVLGEFYWRVQREERALVTDYEGSGAAAARRLSREQTGNEVVWSAGTTLAAALVADAFGIAPAARAALERDVQPVSGSKRTSTGTVVIAIVIVFVLLSILESCDGDDCDDVQRSFGAASNEYRQCLAQRASGGGSRVGGGSYGGWSGGGGHK
jgi:hypothetical protein